VSLTVREAPINDHLWLCSKLSFPWTSDMIALEAVDENEQIVAMVGYQGWRPNSVTMLFAAAKPLAWRCLLKPAFAYPFATRELVRVEIPSHSTEMLSIAKRLGFREAHRVPDGYAKGDDVIELEMRRDECRPLRKV